VGPLITLGALGIAITASTAGALAAPPGAPETLPRHLLLYIGAGIGWTAATLLIPRLERTRGQILLIALVALAMRVPAWCTSPPHSDDVFRYLWDAKVQHAGVSPYAYPPDAPELVHLRDANWSQMNNRQLPTIYPAGAQLLFRVAGGSLGSWKALVAAFDLGLFALLLVWLGRRGDPRRALVWGWSPLVAIELGANAHVDGVGAALLAGALAAWELWPRRRWLAGALLGASAAVKLLALSLVPALRSTAARLAFAAVVAMAVLPRLGASSLGEYGRRWRANDGAFALLHAAADLGVAHSRFAGRYTPDSPTLARLLTGRDRDQIYPDEVAGGLARAAAFTLFLGALVWAAWRLREPAQLALVAVGAFLLLSPTVHPWYVVWILPLLAITPHPAWLAFATAVPLAYVPLPGFRQGGTWHDPAWSRLVEHGAAWVLLAAPILWTRLTRRHRRVRFESP
jgi:hypothetical protein